MDILNTLGDFLKQKAIANPLAEEEEASFLDRIASLPLSLDPMMAYEKDAAFLDIDTWDANAQSISERVGKLLPDERYFLFAGKGPDCALLALEKADLIRVIFDPDFHFPFAVLSEDLSGYLIEDHSGVMVAAGVFEPLLDRTFGA